MTVILTKQSCSIEKSKRDEYRIKTINTWEKYINEKRKGNDTLLKKIQNLFGYNSN